MSKIAVSEFAKRQTKDSPYSYFSGSWGTVLEITEQHFHLALPGYRDGVVLIPVPPHGFYSSVVTLREGDEFAGVYKSRQPGEAPRRQIWVKRAKAPAKSVQIVLYRHDVLVENDEQSCDAEWEIVSINASTDENAVGDVVPKTVGTLLANHFQDSGGTATGWTPERLEKELRVSYFYWKDKANAQE